MAELSYENSTVVRQPWGQVALRPGPSLARQLCSAPPQPGLLCLIERESELLELEGSWLIWTEVSAPGP